MASTSSPFPPQALRSTTAWLARRAPGLLLSDIRRLKAAIRTEDCSSGGAATAGEDSDRCDVTGFGPEAGSLIESAGMATMRHSVCAEIIIEKGITCLDSSSAAIA
jgi:hypothetical protein